MRKITNLGLKNSSAKILPIGSVLLTSRATIGDSAIVREISTTNQGFQSLIPKRNVETEFLYYITKVIFKDMKKFSNGSTFLEISKSQLENIEVNIPSLEEQRKIYVLLSIIDSKIELQRKLIDLYKSLIKSIYTYSIHINNVNITKLSELIQNQIIKVIKPSNLEYFNGYRTYLSTSSIIENKIVSNEGVVSYNERPNRAALKPINNSIWFAKMKNSIKVFLADSYAEQNYIMSTGYYGFLTSDKILSSWLKFTFMSDFFNDQKNRFSEGSSMSAIKESQLNDIYIPIISSKSLLEMSVLFLNKIEKIITVSDKKLNNLLMIKETLLFKLFV